MRVAVVGAGDGFAVIRSGVRLSGLQGEAGQPPGQGAQAGRTGIAVHQRAQLSQRPAAGVEATHAPGDGQQGVFGRVQQQDQRALVHLPGRVAVGGDQLQTLFKIGGQKTRVVREQRESDAQRQALPTLDGSAWLAMEAAHGAQAMGTNR